MIARQKPLTPREKQESEPKPPKYHAHNRTDAKLEKQVAAMLRDGAKAAEIVKALPVTKAVVYRIYNESVLGNVKKPAPKKQPLGRGQFPSPYVRTKCTGQSDCTCVVCGANAIKTPEQIRLMHADDEQERLESHLDALERRGLRSVVEATRNGGAMQ